MPFRIQLMASAMAIVVLAMVVAPLLMARSMIKHHPEHRALQMVNAPAVRAVRLVPVLTSEVLAA
jgi:hypothetical protein